MSLYRVSLKEELTVSLLEIPGDLTVKSLANGCQCIYYYFLCEPVEFFCRNYLIGLGLRCVAVAHAPTLL